MSSSRPQAPADSPAYQAMPGAQTPLARAAGISAGDTATLDIEVTKTWPEPSVPQDLATVQASDPSAAVIPASTMATARPRRSTSANPASTEHRTRRRGRSRSSALSGIAPSAEATAYPLTRMPGTTLRSALQLAPDRALYPL